jgi:hypothetical protein
LRRYEISWEDSLVSVTVEEASQKDWDMDFTLVPRPKGKSVVTSKLIYKIKHVADNSIEIDLWLEDSPSKREKIMMRHFLEEVYIEQRQDT